MRFSLLLCLVLLLAVPPRAGKANGWEHSAIPMHALVIALFDDAAGIRVRAAESLGFRGQVSAVAPLMKRLSKTEPDPRVRSAIYIALGRLRDSRALEPLAACLREEEREELRGDCAHALGLLGDDAGVDLLTQALEGDPAGLVRARAVDALGRFQDALATDALLATLEGGSDGLRLRAIRALGVSAVHRASAPLQTALAAASAQEERRAIVAALARIGAPDARDTLLGAAEEDDPALRSFAALGLAAIEQGGSLPALARLLNDPDGRVRAAAVGGLRHLADPASVPALRGYAARILSKLAEHDDAALVQNAAFAAAELPTLEQALWALVEIDPPGALGVLLTAAESRDLPRTSGAALELLDGLYRVRRVALRGLGYVDDPRSLELLSGRHGLGDPDPRIRAVVVRALGVLEHERSVELVLPSLSDANADIRAMAALVLGRLGDRVAVAPLIERLGDPVAQVRRHAALGLGYLGDAQAGAALAPLAENDPAAAVRDAVGYALELIGGR